MSYTDKTRTMYQSRPPGPEGRRPVQAGAVHPLPPGGRHRGRVPDRRLAQAKSSTCAPTTTSGCRAIPRSSRPPMRAWTPAATACPRSASSAAPRTSTASSSSVTTKFLGTEDTILFPSCMDANAGVFEAILTKDDVMISDRLVHASLIDGIRLCSAMQDTFKHADMAHLEQKLQLHQDKPPPAGHHRRRLLHGRRHRPARRDGRAVRKIRRHAPRRRLPRLGLHRQDRPRDPREVRRHGQDRRHHHDLRQGPRRGDRRLRLRPQGARRDVPPEGPAVPLLQHHRPGRRRGRPQGLRDPERLDRAPRQAGEERGLLAQGPDRGRLRPQGRRHADRPGHALQRQAGPGRLPGPLRRGRFTPSASSSRSSPRARPASGPSSRPATKCTTSTRPSTPSPRSARSSTSWARRKQEIIERMYGN